MKCVFALEMQEILMEKMYKYYSYNKEITEVMSDIIVWTTMRTYLFFMTVILA